MPGFEAWRVKHGLDFAHPFGQAPLHSDPPAQLTVAALAVETI